MCQKSHHTLLHIGDTNSTSADNSSTSPASIQVPTHTAIKLKSSALLMTYRVLVTAPNGSRVVARGLLDNASSASFVSEHLTQSLGLPWVRQNVRVSGITGTSPTPSTHSIATLQISLAHCNERSIELTAIVLQRVTCDLPISRVPFDLSWKHNSDLPLAADPSFGQPGRIDILLGVDIYIEILLHGRRTGPPRHLRLSSGGFSVVHQDKTLPQSRPICMQQLSTPPLLICEVMPSPVNSGKWRRLPLALHFQWRNVLLCNTSMPTIVATLKEDSLYPCPRNQMQEALGSQGPKPFVASRHWRDR